MDADTNNINSNKCSDHIETDGIRWETKHFRELNISELYAVLRLRSQVFIVEQKFNFLDADNYDKVTYHVMAWKGEELIATARLFSSENSNYPGYQAIGRIACASAYRGRGLGKKLMLYSISECARLFGEEDDIKIGAQLRLSSFYGLFGFEPVGQVYFEGVVEHTGMIRPKKRERNNNSQSNSNSNGDSCMSDR